jgi:mono/diheme cytochrome c family protein
MALNARHVLAGFAALGVALWSASAVAQDSGALRDVKIVVVPVQTIRTMDGAALYDAYCASCHGKDLKGHGPAWHFTGTPPVDLTTASAGRDTDTARALHIAATIRAHRTAWPTRREQKALNMPDWVSLFHSLATENGSEAAETTRIYNLANYIASVQAVTTVASHQPAK